MVDTQALRGVIAASGETQISVAEKIGMPFSTFTAKCDANPSTAMICMR